MSKKILIVVAVLIVLATLGVTGYFVLSSKNSLPGGRSERALSIIPKTAEKREAEVKAEALYEDAAGFSFKYPKDTKVTDVTPEGDEYYSELNVSRGSEKLVITVKDTSAKNADIWVKSDSTYSGASLVGATTLGGVSAKQYAKNQTLITVAVDQGILYLIGGPEDGGFWENTQNAIIPTFTFAVASGGSSSGSSSSGIQYEEEEIVE